MAGFFEMKFFNIKDFEIVRQLGAGRCANTFLATIDGLALVLKFVKKTSVIFDHDVPCEIAMLRLVENVPGICKPYAWHEGKEEFIIVKKW
jgi:hypothetical protein